MPPHQPQPQPGKGVSRGATAAPHSVLPGHLSAVTGLTAFPLSTKMSVSPSRQAKGQLKDFALTFPFVSFGPSTVPAI